MIPYFKATYENGRVIVTSNTRWTLVTTPGTNFMCPVSSGDGDCEFEIVYGDNVSYPQGTIKFQYGEKYCKDAPELFVSTTNADYFHVSHDEIELKGENTTEIIIVNSTSNWGYSYEGDNIKCFQYSPNQLMIVSKNGESFEETIDIFPLGGIYQHKSIVVKQSVDTIEGNVLSGYSTQIKDNTYMISVNSTKNGEYCPFEYEVITQPYELDNSSTYVSKKIDNNTIYLETEKPSWEITVRNKENKSIKIKKP